MARCELCGVGVGVKKNGICSKCEPKGSEKGTLDSASGSDTKLEHLEPGTGSAIIAGPEAPTEAGTDPSAPDRDNPKKIEVQEGPPAAETEEENQGFILPDPEKDDPDAAGHGPQPESEEKPVPGESPDTPPADPDTEPEEKTDEDPEEPEEKEDPKIKEEIFSFPSRVRCEYCGSPNVRVTSTKENIRYYECYQIIPMCPGDTETKKRTFKILGKKI